MPNDPYNDPNRIARQLHQQATQTAQQMSKNSQKMAGEMARNAADTHRRVVQENVERSRKGFDQQRARNAALHDVEADYSARPTRQKGGRFIVWLIVVGLVAYGAWRMIGS